MRARFEAGTLPQFNVLRAEVELANARPRLIRARNNYRVAKQNLANLLGYSVPRDVLEDVPLQLTDKLAADPYRVDLSSAIAQALTNRTELAALRKGRELRVQAVQSAKAGYKPSVQIFGGYGSRNSSFSDDLTRDISGWFAGAASVLRSPGKYGRGPACDLVRPAK